MHSHSYENEFNLHVNESHFHMKRWAPRLALRKRLKVIWKWPIVIKACSKIVCHALSRIKTKAIFRFCWVIYCLFLPIFYVRLYWVIYCLFITQFFLLGPLRDVNFTANLTQAKGVISRFDHIFHGYSNRHLTFSTYQHCLLHSTCTMIAIALGIFQILLNLLRDK